MPKGRLRDCPDVSNLYDRKCWLVYTFLAPKKKKKVRGQLKGFSHALPNSGGENKIMAWPNICLNA